MSFPHLRPLAHYKSTRDKALDELLEEKGYPQPEEPTTGDWVLLLGVFCSGAVFGVVVCLIIVAGKILRA